MQMAFHEAHDTYDEYMFFYTDGSSHEASTGCASVFGEAYFTDRLPNHTSVFNAELFAILRAL